MRGGGVQQGTSGFPRLFTHEGTSDGSRPDASPSLQTLLVPPRDIWFVGVMEQIEAVLERPGMGQLERIIALARIVERERDANVAEER